MRRILLALRRRRDGSRLPHHHRGAPDPARAHQRRGRPAIVVPPPAPVIVIPVPAPTRSSSSSPVRRPRPDGPAPAGAPARGGNPSGQIPHQHEPGGAAGREGVLRRVQRPRGPGQRGRDEGAPWAAASTTTSRPRTRRTSTPQVARDPALDLLPGEHRGRRRPKTAVHADDLAPGTGTLTAYCRGGRRPLQRRAHHASADAVRPAHALTRVRARRALLRSLNPPGAC